MLLILDLYLYTSTYPRLEARKLEHSKILEPDGGAGFRDTILGCTTVGWNTVTSVFDNARSGTRPTGSGCDSKTP